MPSAFACSAPVSAVSIGLSFVPIFPAPAKIVRSFAASVSPSATVTPFPASSTMSCDARPMVVASGSAALRLRLFFASVPRYVGPFDESATSVAVASPVVLT